jgi:hypothetical protein
MQYFNTRFSQIQDDIWLMKRHQSSAKKFEVLYDYVLYFFRVVILSNEANLVVLIHKFGTCRDYSKTYDCSKYCDDASCETLTLEMNKRCDLAFACASKIK